MCGLSARRGGAAAPHKTLTAGVLAQSGLVDTPDLLVLLAAVRTHLSRPHPPCRHSLTAHSCSTPLVR